MRKTGKKDLYLKRHSLVRIRVVILVLQAFVSFPALGENKLTSEISVLWSLGIFSLCQICFVKKKFTSSYVSILKKT